MTIPANPGRWHARAAFLIASLIALQISHAEVKLPSVIGDHMVLQSAIRAPIWGTASPGETVRVTVSWSKKDYTARADERGAWMVKVQTPSPGGPYGMTIAGENRIEIQDVLIGEVWVCSGQSNMEMPLGVFGGWRSGILDSAREIEQAAYPKIRLFQVAQTMAPGPKGDCPGKWAECTPASVSPFSAVGYFFGRDLHKKLHVPVGMIESAWGGTRVEAWTSREKIIESGVEKDDLELLEAELSNPDSLKRVNAARWSAWMLSIDTLAGIPKDDSTFLPGPGDTVWKTIQLPQRIDNFGLEKFDGIIWFVRSFAVPDTFLSRELTLDLGPIDDYDVTWINDREVGRTYREFSSWVTRRHYTVPPGIIRRGLNTIAIRVQDVAGLGGLWGRAGELRLWFGDTANALALAGEWRYRTGIDAAHLPPFPEEQNLHPNRATILFNGMISPLIPYGIRGAIWYQGESNAPDPASYRKLFPAMIKDWRTRWNLGDFPFYYVQIAPYKYGPESDAAGLREAQRMTLSVRNTGMVVTSDIGNVDDIHPKNKQEVSRRLLLWALAKTYGKKGITFSGPLYRSMKVRGEAIRIYLDHVDGGLVAHGDTLREFTVAGEDRKFHEAAARIDGGSVLVSSPEVPNPVAVRFGYTNTSEPNLFNKRGLPASPFRTDNW